jgi:GTP-binding protein
VLIAKDPGIASAYALWKLEERGYMIIPPGTEVYAGMIIGEHNRDIDIIVNVIKSKHLTNMRAAGSDDNILLTPYRKMSLEECVTFINEDECVEVTPNVLRIRKAELDEHRRKAAAKTDLAD